MDKAEDAVGFFIHPVQALDNFSAHTVRIWGKTFQTAEHAFQWKKYSSEASVADQIFNAGNPWLAKRIARANSDKRPSDWDTQKLPAMREIVRAKLSQHADVREVLEATGDSPIYEDSAEDAFWGRGPDRKGENQLGRIWMELRSELA